MDIIELRQEIDYIDSELVQLFCKRMEVAAHIADYKRENNLPIHHPAREQEVLQKVAVLAGSDMDRYIMDLYTKIFELSKDYQFTRNNR